jgi:hypothetical protein
VADTAVLERMDRIWDEAQERRRDRERKRREKPLVRLWDGDWVLRGRVSGEFDAHFEWKLNDTGAGTITMPAEHHLAVWAASYWDRRSCRNIHVTVDKDGARWGGRLESVKTEQDEQGSRTVTLNFLHDYEELKHLLVWSNPFTPAAVQFPRVFILAGPSRYMLKLAMFLNLARMQGNWWAMPDDPLDVRSWVQSVAMREWPIMVKPDSLLLDDTPWCILSSRFKTWAEMAAGTLADAQLMVECRRWLNGDPPPWPGARPRNGQLIVDIVDKSGWFDQTAVGGTILGGLARTVLTVADDLVDESQQSIGKVVESNEYTVSGFLGTAPKNPWVVLRTDSSGGTNIVESTSFTWQPATVTQLVTGGHSMPGVNEGIKAVIQMAGALAEAYLMVPNLVEPAVTLLEPLFEDTLMAFMSFKSLQRSSTLGWSHYMEDFVSGADQAYTLSSILAMRAGMRATRERTSHTMQIGDGSPYLIGEQGQGHFFLGDRVGGEIPGSAGRIAVDQVTDLTLSWDAETPHEWSATVGDPDTDQDPVDWVIGQVKEGAGALHDLGVL